ncbi:Guanine Nucleotide-Binding Protein G(S) Subunit Alpha Isoforms Short [Manis pentadactyla]|nr:Guanine Nucleotide-Binding Protein G(S) Subunit Alpha Isoforms Short [Manis pentadactyla]
MEKQLQKDEQVSWAPRRLPLLALQRCLRPNAARIRKTKRLSQIHSDRGRIEISAGARPALSLGLPTNINITTFSEGMG